MSTTRFLQMAILAIMLGACASDGPTRANRNESARINTQLGIDYMRQGQYDHAQEKLNKAIDQDPDYAVAHSSIAFLYQQRGEIKLAEKHYRRALSLDSGNALTMNNFGVFLCGQGKVTEAEKYFMAAVQAKRYATPEAAWTNAGLCAMAFNPAKAEQYFREALRINPELGEALAQMAVLSFQQKDYLRSRGFLQRFEVVGRPTAETLWVGAQTERALGDELAAHRYEARLKRDFPESQEAVNLSKKSSNDS